MGKKSGKCKVLTLDFETAKDAEKLLENLKDIVSKDGVAYLADACELYGIMEYPKENISIKIPNPEKLKVREVITYELDIPYDFE